MREHRLQFAILIGIALLVLWPLPLGQGFLGHPLSDLPDHAQGAWWWGLEINSLRLPLVTTVTHLPAGQELWYVDPVGAAIMVILRPLGFPWAFNLTIMAEVLLAGVLLYRLCWRLFEQRGAALLAATIGMSAPFLLGLVHSGLSEYLGLFFPVLFLGDLLLVLEGRKRAWLFAAIGVALCGAQALYYAAFAVLLMLCLIVGKGAKQRALRILPVVGLGLVCCIPLAWHVLSGILGGGGAVEAATAPGWQQPTLPATDVSLFFRPGDHYFPDTPALGNPGILHVHYLGWVALLLAIWGFVKHPKLSSHRWGVLVFFVFALGPALAWGGELVMLGLEPLSLPLAVLYRLPFSPWDLVHHPYRMTAFLVPLLAVGAAATVSTLPRWAAYVAMPLVLVESLLISPAVWPLPVTPHEAPAVYAQLPDPGGVFDWPPDATTENRRYQIWQIEHERAVPYGVNVFLREPLMRDPMVAELLSVLDDPARRVRNRDVPYPPTFPEPKGGGWSSLGEIGLRYMVLHPDAMGSRELGKTRAILRAWLGEPVIVGSDAEVWEIPLEAATRE